MPNPIDVHHVARLAGLSLGEAEASRLQGELVKIVTYIEQLDELDTTDVPPTAHVQLERLPVRNDEVRPGLSHDDALAQAPAVEDGEFAVPPFVESGE